MTNRDVINSLSNEELAKVVFGREDIINDFCKNRCKNRCDDENADCCYTDVEIFTKWLESEA